MTSQIIQRLLFNRISTHTPVRVWHFSVTLFGQQYISTHTPVRVWQTATGVSEGVCNFNSHTREGVTTFINARQTKIIISTHTPVRVWLYRAPKDEKAKISTHTPVRVWPQEKWTVKVSGRFQLTHPWGCDAFHSSSYNHLTYFNSHTREGVTLLLQKCMKIRDFNSHTREGVTKYAYPIYSADTFQLTHPWGCDSLKLQW